MQSAFLLLAVTLIAIWLSSLVSLVINVIVSESEADAHQRYAACQQFRRVLQELFVSLWQYFIWSI